MGAEVVGIFSDLFRIGLVHANDPNLYQLEFQFLESSFAKMT